MTDDVRVFVKERKESIIKLLELIILTITAILFIVNELKESGLMTIFFGVSALVLLAVSLLIGALTIFSLSFTGKNEYFPTLGKPHGGLVIRQINVSNYLFWKAESIITFVYGVAIVFIILMLVLFYVYPSLLEGFLKYPIFCFN